MTKREIENFLKRYEEPFEPKFTKDTRVEVTEGQLVGARGLVTRSMNQGYAHGEHCSVKLEGGRTVTLPAAHLKQMPSTTEEQLSLL